MAYRYNCTPKVKLESPLHLPAKFMCLVCGRKLEYLERTHRDAGRSCKLGSGAPWSWDLWDAERTAAPLCRPTLNKYLRKRQLQHLKVVKNASSWFNNPAIGTEKKSGLTILTSAFNLNPVQPGVCLIYPRWRLMALSACVSEALKGEMSAEVGSLPHLKWRGQPLDVISARH